MSTATPTTVLLVDDHELIRSGLAGVFDLEDDMHIMENGAELFTPQSPSLENPFGK